MDRLLGYDALLAFRRYVFASSVKVQVFFFVIPFYLQSVPVHSARCVETYAVACRRVFSSGPL
jgi:hypothetical protein